MFTGIAKYLTRSGITSENSKRQRQFLSWNKIEKIALLIDDKKLSKNEIDKFIDSIKKYVEVFYVELSSKEPPYADWKCFVKKNKNFLGLPNTQTIDLVKGKKFDVVINACIKKDLYAANLTSQFKASFKCGHTNLYGELDLIIEKTEGQNLSSYLKEVQRYLEMIKTN